MKGAHATPFAVRVELDEAWRFAWPRPQRVALGAMVFPVSAEGIMDVSQWQQQAAAGLDFRDPVQSLKVLWFENIKDMVSPEGCVSLIGLLSDTRLLVDDKLVAVWLQVIVQVAQRIELMIVKGMNGTPETLPIRAEAGNDDESWHAREVDRACLRHRAAARRATKQFQNVGIACDKVGGCRGFEIQNAFMTLPNNTAFELFPQVWIRWNFVVS